MASAAALSWFLVTSLTGLGILPAPTTPAEALVCVPKPASALEDLDYKKFSGDWREVLKSKHAPVLLQKGSWRFDFDTNTFAFSAALAGNETCLPAIVGKVHKVLPVGQFQLEYDFFGQPVQETLAVVATDYGSYAVLHRCAHEQPHASVCAPDATHVSVLARHVLERDTSLEITRHLENVCVAVAQLEPHEFDEACTLPSDEDPTLAEIPPGTGICFLERKEGFCANKQTVFYYDREQRSCLNFTFTGCGANENHFLTRQECVERCEKPLEQARAPPVESESAQCPQRAACGLACAHCCQRREKDSCIACNCLASETEPLLKKADCLAAPELCPAGCQSREVSASCYACECAAADGTVEYALGACKLPVKEGNCNERIPRYFFNVTSGVCDVFYYTGCGGNENSFASHEECIAQCEDPCRLPMDPGSCNDTQERYYFNSQTGLCETFEYGGCEGNKNNFADLDACKTLCEVHVAEDGAAGKDRVHVAEDGVAGKDREMCHQPVDEGHCDTDSSGPGATTPEVRFYYDVQKELCERFNYQGCGGNDNNFRTVDGCNMTCFGVRINLARTAASCPESMQCSCGDEQEAKCGSCECGNAAPRSNGAALYALVFLTGASVTASLCTL
ncbi:uncharacterized protein LOC144115886 isoform X11 [Amblyomma americanum]